MRLFLVLVFASLSGVFGDWPKFCGDYPLTYKSLFNETPEENPLPVDIILQSYCPPYFNYIDFGQKSQNLMIHFHDANSSAEQFFLKLENVEHFLLKNLSNPEDEGRNVTLVHEIVNMSHEDSLKYQLFPIQITRREVLAKLDNNETYIDATIQMSTEVMVDPPWIKLSPGWVKNLGSMPEMLTQTMILSENGTLLLEQEVYVMLGWLNITKYPGFHGISDRRSKRIEYITIFLQKPAVLNLFPGKVDVTIHRKVSDGIALENGDLSPGWAGILDYPTKQFLTFDHKDGHGVYTEQVTVWPGQHPVKPSKGWIAAYNLGYGAVGITIYRFPEKGPPENDPENRAGMYVTAEIVQQVNQTFVDYKVGLSPGWSGKLERETHQILVPLMDSDVNSTFTGQQNATVYPGWKVFIGSDHGFNAVYYFDNGRYPISVEFTR